MNLKEARWFCRQFAAHLRSDIEDAERSIHFEGGMSQMFGGVHTKEAMLSHRKAWAELLATLYAVESAFNTLGDEWWNGPKMESEPHVGDKGGLGYMLSCMRDGQSRVHAEQRRQHDDWEKEQRNEHWTRRKEAEAQVKNPGRRFSIEREGRDAEKQTE